MSSLEATFETALDESSDETARENAIDQLEAANECDMLAELVTSNDVGGRFREQALAALGHPQCHSMLEKLVDGGSLPEEFQDRAERVLEKTPEDAGAGP